MTLRLLALLSCLNGLLLTGSGAAERTPPEIPGTIATWDLAPVYALPGSDRVVSNPVPESPEARAIGRPLPPERMLIGQRPTDRFLPEGETELSPGAPFTITFWVNYHVNTRVGALALLTPRGGDTPAWFFGFDKGEVLGGAGTAIEPLILPGMEIKGDVEYRFEEALYPRGDFRYWHHLAATWDGDILRIYRNGELLGEQRVLAPGGAEPLDFELAAYLEREPHMVLGDLVKNAGLYDRALSPEELAALYRFRRDLAAEGILYPDRFHFTTTAPHLAFPGPDRITLFWETDRPASARIHWGTDRETTEVRELPANGQRARQVTLTGLKPNTEYAYRVVARDADGNTLDSGLLRFRTAVLPGDPIVFAAISDTEARPHVNAHLANLLWSETPHLLINAGDLTDGGKRNHRVEWTHEYFAAMGAFMARTPVIPVMGNGEDDYVWFEHYHALPEGRRTYFDYRYGDVHFFVLDSNLNKRDREEPGFRAQQRRWFESALAASDAPWKVVSFHHPALPERHEKVAADFVDLIDRHEVDLVLAGHHHNYRRSWPLRGASAVVEAGPVYIQLGGGGGNRSSRPDTPDLRWAKTYQGYSYSLFRVHGNTLKVALHDDHGAVRETFTLHKSRSSFPTAQR